MICKVLCFRHSFKHLQRDIPFATPQSGRLLTLDCVLRQVAGASPKGLHIIPYMNHTESLQTLHKRARSRNSHAMVNTAGVFAILWLAVQCYNSNTNQQPTAGLMSHSFTHTQPSVSDPYCSEEAPSQNPLAESSRGQHLKFTPHSSQLTAKLSFLRYRKKTLVALAHHKCTSRSHTSYTAPSTRTWACTHACTNRNIRTLVRGEHVRAWCTGSLASSCVNATTHTSIT